MKRLAILGASGHGKVVGDAAECAGWKEIVFFDDAWPTLSVNGKWPVNGSTAELVKDIKSFDGVVVAIGDNEIRLKKSHELMSKGMSLVTIVHPSAQVSQSSRIGDGSVVLAATVVNIDACLGVAVIVNTGSTIDHDCRLGDGVHVSPGAHLAGDVVVGDLTWIGIGVCVNQNVRIGEHVIVGAGAVVIGDVLDNLKVAGVPAVPMDKNE